MFDGVPWQIDGVILLYGKNGAQKTNAARTMSTFLLVKRSRNSTCSQRRSKLARRNSDRQGAFPLRRRNNGQHRHPLWRSCPPLHGRLAQKEKPTKKKRSIKPGTRNLSPSRITTSICGYTTCRSQIQRQSKEVRSITFESTKKAAALMVAAMSVGPADAAKLPNEVFGKGKFPDLRKRTGAVETGEGYVYSNEGKPLANAVVSIIAARNYESGELNENPPGVQATTDRQRSFRIQRIA